MRFDLPSPAPGATALRAELREFLAGRDWSPAIRAPLLDGLRPRLFARAGREGLDRHGLAPRLWRP